MSHIHFIGGEKGGVGKSVVAGLVTQYCIDHELAFVAVDADASHRGLSRHYSPFARTVDLADAQSTDTIMDLALQTDQHVVVDLPAQSIRNLLAWIESADVLGFASENDVRITFWHVTDGGFDSVGALAVLVDHFRDRVGYVIMRNAGRARSFAQLDASEARAKCLQNGGEEALIPELDPLIMYRVDEYGSSFWAAVNDKSSKLALSSMDRQRTRLWLRRCFEALTCLGVLTRPRSAEAGPAQEPDPAPPANSAF